MKSFNARNKLTIVFPTLNEGENSFFKQSLEQFKKVDNLEVIIVDGGSHDDTKSLVEQYGFKFIAANANSRAERINRGVEAASNPLILLNHPRSFLELDGIEALTNMNFDSLRWGGFTHKFDFDHLLLNFTSWYSNQGRPKLQNILYLDHCIFFFKEDFIAAGPIPKVDIFEDTLLSKQLSKYCGKPMILPYISLTSAVRFKQRGIWKQALTNQIMKWFYYFNIDHKKMNKIYEKKSPLNSKYDKS